VFEKAIANAPSVIVIDEMEAFLTDRNVGRLSGVSHIEEVSEFLRRIPEASKNKVLIIGMTNMLDSIEPAILRKGRFDNIIEVTMPSAEEVKQLLNHLLLKLPVTEDIDLYLLAERLEGRPLSDIAFVVKEAGRLAVKQRRETINNNVLLSAATLLPSIKENNRIGF
jgi:SpoVK/Ycf46/Vps4 family AAA+-type ATPase